METNKIRDDGPVPLAVMTVAFKKGDFVVIEYTARIKETGEVIETTDAEMARQAKIYDEEKVYEPLLVILGEGRVVKGLEEALYSMDVGSEQEVEVPPEKAYGARDPKKVRVLPLREFRRANIEPRPGKIVEINGVPAVVKSVSGGRVVVDFNHPLAGKTLVYRVKVVARIESPEEKIRALIHRRMRRIPADRIKINLDEKERIVEVEVPEEAFLAEDIQYAKKAAAVEVFRYLPWIREVRYVERHVNPEPAEPEKAGSRETEKQPSQQPGQEPGGAEAPEDTQEAPEPQGS